MDDKNFSELLMNSLLDKNNQADMQKILARVDAKKAQLDQYRPLHPTTAKSLRDSLALEWTYHSNGIEGNTLTLIETRVVIEDGITIGGKSVREHLEAINHKEAIYFVEDMVKTSDKINLWDIKNIHKIVLKSINERVAGKFRQVNVKIMGASFNPPNYMKVEQQMRELKDWYQNDTNNLHPIERAAHLHTKFVKIHPFEDGNGRTARLLMNFELMRRGYPPAIIEQDKKSSYYAALDDFCTKDETNAFTQIVALSVAKSIDVYLEVITGEKQQPIPPVNLVKSLADQQEESRGRGR